MLKKFGLTAALASLTGCVVYPVDQPVYRVTPAYVTVTPIIQPLPHRYSECHHHLRVAENCNRLSYTHQIHACRQNAMSYYNSCLYR